MTDEERRLAELLQQAVPQPPRPVSADDIAARVAGRRRVALPPFQPWLPALAAACVLLAIAGTSVWLITGRTTSSAPTGRPSSTGTNTSADLSPSSSASTASSASRASSASSSARPPAARSSARHTATGSVRPSPNATTSLVPDGVIGAWGPRLLNNAQLGPVIVGGSNAIYGVVASQVDRFDPASGATTAQAPLDPNASWPPLVTSRALWLTVVTPGTITIEMLDPATLRQIGSSRIAAATPSGTGRHWTPVLAANADDSKIFLGNADQIYSLDPTSGTVQHQFGVTGLIGGLAVSPDNSRLYAGVDIPGSEPHLLILDLQHGLATLSNTVLPNSQDSAITGHGVVTGVLAASGGAWVTVLYTYLTDGSSASNIAFVPLNDPSHPRDAIPGGGGTTATLANGAVFLSDIYKIQCADPRTGAIRAEADELGEMGFSNNFYSVQLVAGHYLASFQSNYSDQRGLAVLHPPAACAG